MGIFEKFKFGFKKSAENIKSGLRAVSYTHLRAHET